LYEFRRLPFEQTRVTLRTKTDVSGSIPTQLSAIALSGILNSVRSAYVLYQRDEEVDRMEREQFIRTGMKEKQLSKNESSMVTRCLATADFNNIGGKVERRMTTAGMMVTKRANWNRLKDQRFEDSEVKKYTKMLKNDPSVWGKAVAVVHARPEEILAWTWFFCSNARTQLHTKVEGNLLRRQYEPTQEGEMNTREKTLFYLDDNTRSTHYCTRKAMTAPFKTRESNMR